MRFSASESRSSVASRKLRVVGWLVLPLIVLSGAATLGVLLSGARSLPISSITANGVILAEDLSVPSVGATARYLEVISDLTDGFLTRTETEHTLEVIEVSEDSYTVRHTKRDALRDAALDSQLFVTEHVIDRVAHVPIHYESTASLEYPASISFAWEALWDSEMKITANTTWEGQIASYAAAEGTLEGTPVIEVVGDGGITKASYTIRADGWPAVVKRLTILMETIDLSMVEVPVVYYPEKPVDMDLPPEIPVNIDEVSTFLRSEIRLLGNW